MPDAWLDQSPVGKSLRWERPREDQRTRSAKQVDRLSEHADVFSFVDSSDVQDKAFGETIQASHPVDRARGDRAELIPDAEGGHRDPLAGEAAGGDRIGRLAA